MHSPETGLHGPGSPHPEVRSEAEPRRTRAARRAKPDSVLRKVAAALAPFGLILRGGFHPEPGEAGLEGAGAVLMVGNAGPAMWHAFAPFEDGAPDPLNRWTVRVIEQIGRLFGARALYPFGEPYWPFQQWARRAEGLYASPLGLLIHPQFGLWHAYRAALLFEEPIPLPARVEVQNPCELCANKPCLTACPAGAFSQAGYDVPTCASHLQRANAECVDAGCRARDACPVGAEWRYPPAQVRFHMRAFARSVAGK